MKIKKIKPRYLIFFIVIIILTFSSIYADTEQKPIRLAVWNKPNSAIIKENGDISGFEPDLFMALTSSLKRAVEIKVYDSKILSIEAVLNNDADVVMSTVYEEGLNTDLEYNQLMVRHVESIICSLNKKIAYQDYASMNNKRIGYISRGPYSNLILDYINSKIENPQVKLFYTSKDILNSLKNSEIDFAVIELDAKSDDLNILDRFNPLPTYYITRKGEAKNIDQAFSMFLNNSSDTYHDLFNQYFSSAISSEFSKEEKDYIHTNPNLLVATVSNKNIFSSLDDNYKIIGIFPDIIRELSKISGLNLKLIVNEENIPLPEMIAQNNCNAAIGLDCLKSIKYNSDFTYCNPVMEIPMELIVNKNTMLDKKLINSVVVSKINCQTDVFIKQNYPKWKIIYEPDINNRYDMLIRGDVDCLIDSSYSFNYMRGNPKYENTSRYPIVFFTSDLNIVLDKNLDPILASIINKSIITLRKTKLDNIIENNISTIVYTPTFYDLFLTHRLEYLGILLLIFFFLLILYILASNRRRKQLEKSNNELIKAEQSAIKANQAKSVFLARMSHDMRTPLGAVIGLAEFGMKETKDNQIKSYFTDINDSAKYLLSLMDDILDSQKLQNENFDFNFSLVFLCDTIKKVKTYVENRAKEKKIKLDISSNCMNFKRCIYADEKRLSQILVNILSNAIKYTPSEGSIIWDIDFKQISAKQVLLSTKIQDTGVGMSQEFVNNHLFKPFSKENNSLSKSEGGSGLGLNICKKLIDQMKGKIICESSIGRGTTFEIELVYDIASEEDTKLYFENKRELSKDNQTNCLSGVRVLVCDDTEINIKIAKKILEKRLIEVDIAYNGQEAIDKVLLNEYQAILMDIRMPILDGLEATKKIREFNKEIPIIAFSANAYSEDINKSLSVGMNAHLAKPIDTEILFNTLEKLICNK